MGTELSGVGRGYCGTCCSLYEMSNVINGVGGKICEGIGGISVTNNGGEEEEEDGLEVSGGDVQKVNAR